MGNLPTYNDGVRIIHRYPIAVDICDKEVRAVPAWDVDCLTPAAGPELGHEAVRLDDLPERTERRQRRAQRLYVLPAPGLEVIEHPVRARRS